MGSTRPVSLSQAFRFGSPQAPPHLRPAVGHASLFPAPSYIYRSPQRCDSTGGRRHRNALRIPGQRSCLVLAGDPVVVPQGAAPGAAAGPGAQRARCPEQGAGPWGLPGRDSRATSCVQGSPSLTLPAPPLSPPKPCAPTHSSPNPSGSPHPAPEEPHVPQFACSCWLSAGPESDGCWLLEGDPLPCPLPLRGPRPPLGQLLLSSVPGCRGPTEHHAQGGPHSPCAS